MKATLKNLVNEISVEVHSTTEHPASSYGRAVWVDDENNAYFEVDGPVPPFYSLTDITND